LYPKFENIPSGTQTLGPPNLAPQGLGCLNFHIHIRKGKKYSEDIYVKEIMYYNKTI